jgi:small subunit ribosomal protein S20
MAHSVSARKRIRQNEARRLQNKSTKSAFRTEIKHVLELVEAGKLDEAKAHVPTAMKRIDKAARTRAIHPNAASRYKSRLNRALDRAKVKAAKTAAAPGKGAPAKARGKAKK